NPLGGCQVPNQLLLPRPKRHARLGHGAPKRREYSQNHGKEQRAAEKLSALAYRFGGSDAREGPILSPGGHEAIPSGVGAGAAAAAAAASGTGVGGREC